MKTFHLSTPTFGNCMKTKLRASSTSNLVKKQPLRALSIASRNEPTLLSASKYKFRGSQFLSWSRAEDALRFQAFSAEPEKKGTGSGSKEPESNNPYMGISFLRAELIRIRPGMSDYIMRFATPKVSKEFPNTIITLRGSKIQSSADGALGTARVIAREMTKKGDKTHKWESANIDHLSKMLLPHLKYFGSITSAEKLLFSTDALL